ncbi:MAG: hypothetical protein NTV94_11645 [Planctomycetota bacterium]|nr:hypothetical protein [Planctomycetota bacterium]
MQFLNYLLTHPQVLIGALVIIGPVISAIGKKLKEQSDARQREIARERAKIEALRTGGRIDDEAATATSVPVRRPSPIPAARNARASLEELAAKRRAELTNQAPAQAQAQPTATARGDTIVGIPQSIPGSTGTTVQSQQNAAKNEQRVRDQKVREQQQQQQQREQRRRDQQRAATKQAEIDRSQNARTGSMRQEQIRREVAPAARRPEPVLSNAEGPASSMDRGQFRRDEAAAAASVAAAQASAKKSRSQWRHAIVMQELLAQPVSIRRPQE